MAERHRIDKPEGCLLCGYSTHITRHHIVPKSKGGKLHPLNKLWVCPNCHQECEMGIYSVEFQKAVVKRWLTKLGHDIDALINEYENENESPSREPKESDHSESVSGGSSDPLGDVEGQRPPDQTGTV